ncbi:UvrD-helicase domain-containing protein [Mucilaginibacter sp.]|uniref:UvrD-helicase domain-containing protein n=1 Tax=Mucilaginibacter sp. TaxID=1882438 RepID=UPI00345B8C0D
MLAEEYITNHPRMINILQKRFKYVFVDEMQDMAKHQYDLLEKLFAGAPTGGYQRIGDKNQAIHNDESDMADVWKERNVKELNGSHRLNPLIAAIVEPLALNAIKITGSKSNSDGTSIDIRPVMLVYNTASVNKVIPKYAKIINDLIAAGKINPKSENIFKAVAWTTSRAGDRSGIFKLNHYYPDFSKEQLKLQINYSCLESYLHYYETGPAKLASIRKSILNGLLKVFRLENIQNPDNGRAFTKKTFIEHLKTTHFSIEQKFKLYLYLTAKKVAENKIAEALTLYVRLIKATLKRFGVNISGSKPFIDGKHTSGTTTASAPIIKPANQYILDGVTIDISTVHAVKGQTHTCTLYMESFYQIAVDSKGQYESSRIADQLQGIALPATAHDYIKQSLKMTYVGFSRPTHLLCFAIHKLRYDQLYSGKPETAKWNIVQV